LIRCLSKILNYFLIARVEQIYGKDGFVRLKSFSDFPERYLSLKKVYIDFWGDKKIFYVEDIRDIKGRIIIKFKKFDNPRDSNVLIDRDLYVGEDDLVSLPSNYFFIHDLIGSEVIAGKEKIGTVADVLKGKANDVLVILSDDKEEKMMPFVLSYIEKFDAAQKRLILNITKDFFEDYED
jgi:16S rRNA processing protein RimM